MDFSKCLINLSWWKLLKCLINLSWWKLLHDGRTQGLRVLLLWHLFHHNLNLDTIQGYCHNGALLLVNTDLVLPFRLLIGLVYRQSRVLSNLGAGGNLVGHLGAKAIFSIRYMKCKNVHIDFQIIMVQAAHQSVSVNSRQYPP